MKLSFTFFLIICFVQLNGQIIDYNQKESLLMIRNDSTFTRADQKPFYGVIKTISEGEIELSYYFDGFPSVDSSFYTTKKLKSVIRYQHNKVMGRFLFDQHGKKFQEDIYLDSNRTSKQSMWWHSNGQLWRIEMYYNGQKSGKWYEWFKNGNLLFEGEFRQGNKYGIWTYYNTETKQIIRQEQY